MIKWNLFFSYWKITEETDIENDFKAHVFGNMLRVMSFFFSQVKMFFFFTIKQYGACWNVFSYYMKSGQAVENWKNKEGYFLACRIGSYTEVITNIPHGVLFFVIDIYAEGKSD